MDSSRDDGCEAAGPRVRGLSRRDACAGVRASERERPRTRFGGALIGNLTECCDQRCLGAIQLFGRWHLGRHGLPGKNSRILPPDIQLCLRLDHRTAQAFIRGHIDELVKMGHDRQCQSIDPAPDCVRTLDALGPKRTVARGGDATRPPLASSSCTSQQWPFRRQAVQKPLPRQRPERRQGSAR
jgi:hypothetical protein